MHLGAPFLVGTAREKQQVNFDELRLIQKELEQSLHSDGKSLEFDAIKRTSKWRIFEQRLADEFNRQQADLSAKKIESVYWRTLSSISVVLAGFTLGTLIGVRRQLAKRLYFPDEAESGTAEPLR